MSGRERKVCTCLDPAWRRANDEAVTEMTIPRQSPDKKDRRTFLYSSQ